MLATVDRRIQAAVVASAVLAATLWWIYRDQSWAPSLACNILTSAVTIWIVNVLIAGTERRRRKRERKRRRHIRVARANRRRLEIRTLLGAETNWPVLMCLNLGHEVMEHAERGALLPRRDGYSPQLSRLRDVTLTFGRLFTANELAWLYSLRMGLESLLDLPEEDHGTVEWRIHVVGALDTIAVSARALMTSFVLHDALNQVDRFSRRVNVLRRQWNVPEHRRRLRENEEGEHLVAE